MILLKQEFWRIVRIYPSGQLQLDMGMGVLRIFVLVCCLQAAQKKNRFRRSLHKFVLSALYQTLWQRLATPVCSSTQSISANPKIKLIMINKRRFGIKA